MQKSVITMRRIARVAGVSVSAVSLALRNQPRISEAERKRIAAVADQLGYRRDPEVTKLMEHLRTHRQARRSSVLAVVVPELRREDLPGYSPLNEMIQGIRKQGEEVGFETELFFLAAPGMTPARLRAILATRAIRGVIIAPYASGVGTLEMDISGFSVATIGYSIVHPRLHRACPNYLQMMDELLEQLRKMRFNRIGFIMTYRRGGVGHKLLTSAFLYHQSLLAREDVVPILLRDMICKENIQSWLEVHKPDVVVSSGHIYRLLGKLGYSIPGDFHFANIDLAEAPREAAGMDHRYQLVGAEAVNLVLSQFTLNVTGAPRSPKVVLVDSHWRSGFTLPEQGKLCPCEVLGRAK